MIKPALALSLFANAFLAGYVVSGFSGPMRPPPPPFVRMEMAADHISPQYREKIRTLVDGHRKILDRRMQEMREEFDRIHAILTAPTFDAGALQDIRRNARGQEGEAKDEMLSLLIEIARTLPDEERVKFFRESAPDRPPPGAPP